MYVFSSLHAISDGCILKTPIKKGKEGQVWVRVRSQLPEDKIAVADQSDSQSPSFEENWEISDEDWEISDEDWEISDEEKAYRNGDYQEDLFLANLYKVQGRYDAAEPLRKVKLGDDHPDTLTSMNNLAILLCTYFALLLKYIYYILLLLSIDYYYYLSTIIIIYIYTRSYMPLYLSFLLLII